MRAAKRPKNAWTGLEGERSIFNALTEFNPWWQENGRIGDVEPYRRQDFHPLKKKLETEKIVTLIGARQVGKTTLLMQLISDLLVVGKTTPKNILYAGLDDPKITLFSKEPLADIIKIYQEYVLKENIVGSKEKKYIFLDEIQKIRDWSVFLKTLVDKKANTVFLVSGSSSTLLYEQASETLPGRHVEQVLLPFKFIESVKFSRFLSGREDYEKIARMALDTRDELRKELKTNSSDRIFESFKSTYFNMAGEEAELKGLFNEYLVRGGYPEIIKTADMRRCYSLFHGYLADIILKDVQPAFQIRDPGLMSNLVFLICNLTGQKLNVEKLCQILGRNRITIENYIAALEKVYFVSLSHGYTRRKTGVSNTAPKIYVKDIGFRNGILGKLSQSILSEDLGQEVETAVFDHCQRLCFNLSNGAKSELRHWSSSQTGREVDIVLEYDNVTVPIEVKYANEIKDSEISGLRTFMKDFECDIGFVITKDRLDLQEGIVYVPAWLFLTMV